eukprot:7981919-Alexandrium_andersonii.AAC.1
MHPPSYATRTLIISLSKAEDARRQLVAHFSGVAWVACGLVSDELAQCKALLAVAAPEQHSADELRSAVALVRGADATSVGAAL